MTGIGGVVRWDLGNPRDTLDSLLPSLSYWGLEGGEWVEGQAGFAFRAPQDRMGLLHDPVSDRTILADLRLDNRSELRETLGSGSGSEPENDLQIVLLAYERWGESCPRWLLGDFAFAIWDGRRRTLFCARDSMGVRPFCYAERGGLFVFASDIRTVMATPGLRADPDLRFIAELVQARGDSALSFDRTAFRGVFRLPPATSLTAHSGGLRLSRYWRPDEAPPVRLRDDEEYFERLRGLLQQAVACRLGPEPLQAAHLSGGLDSSMVTVLASRQLAMAGRRLTSFSWAPPFSPDEGPPEDERRLVEAVRHQESLPVAYTEVSVRDVALTRLRNVGLFPTAGYYHEVSVRRRAAEQGVRVLLSGWGGDETISFNGRGYWADLFRRGRWITLERELMDRGRLFGRTDREGAWRNFKQTVLPIWMPQAWLRRYRPGLARLPTFMPGCLQPGFAAELRRAGPPGPRLADRAGVRANQIAQIGSGLIVARLEAWASNAAPHGFEYRFPLLDRRVVEFSLGLPPRMYLRGGWDRYIVRKTARGLLPDPVAWALDKSEPATHAANRRVIGVWRRQITRTLDDLAAGGGAFRCLDAKAIRYVREGADALEERFQEVRLAAGIVAEILQNPSMRDRLIDAFPEAL